MNMNNIRIFFEPSSFIEHEVLRPLSHIRGNWDLYIDKESGRYLEEEDSFAALFNALIDELAVTQPPLRYHDNEDCLGEYVQRHLNWNIKKSGRVWINQDGSRLHPSDYLSLLEQGAFNKEGINNLVLVPCNIIYFVFMENMIYWRQSNKGGCYVAKISSNPYQRRA